MKRWLIALAVAALLLVAAVLPANAALSQADAMALAKQAGFEGEVHVVPTGPNGDVNGVYRSYECFMFFFCTPVEPYIVLWQPDWVPDDNMKLILLHEVAHHVQFTTEMPNGETLFEALGVPNREWEADIWALLKAEELGIKDALGKEVSMWAALLKKDGNRCGPYHGCISDRVHYMIARLRPDLSGVQAP